MIKNVVCGISGGIDSAVSAYLLKKNNFNVIGVFMSNWDAKDETTLCSTDIDREDAKYVCDMLKIPFQEVNFVKDYWNNVFESTINSYKMASTPNPDILCNKFIKFDKFAKYCLSNLKADAFATGHYARSVLDIDMIADRDREVALLRRPLDKVKDQTFWLCQVDPHYLSKCIFPLGNIIKPDVKKIGHELGFHRTLARKESMGICFIGKRKFRHFINSYIEPSRGVFSDLETAKIIGEHDGVHMFTLGQKSGLSYGQSAAYVATLNPVTQEIQTVFNRNHPALFMKTVLTGVPHWLGSCPMREGGATRLRLQYQNKYVSIPCTVQYTDRECGGGLTIRLDEWFRCVAPGQYAVLYSEDDSSCVGSAQILTSVSAYDEGLREPFNWRSEDYENQYLVYPETLPQRRTA